MMRTATLCPEAYEHRPYVRRLYFGARNEIKTALKAIGLDTPRRFLIFAQGRTGSTLLTSTLDRHSNICCDDEILGTPRVRPTAYMLNRARASGAPVYGFHVKYYQLSAWQRVTDVRSWLHAAHESGWSILALRRENPLRQAVSNALAARTGTYHLPRSRTEATCASIVLAPDALRREVAFRRRVQEAEAAALRDLPHLALSYEANLLSPAAQAATFTRIQDWLDLPQEPLQPVLRKIAVRPLSELISNFAEVCAALDGSPEAELLEAV